MKPYPWSYSKLKSFEQCPKQFYHIKVAREYEEPETEAIRYGNLFHKAAEDYIRDATPLSESFSFAKNALDALNNLPGEKLCEIKLGLDASLKPCDFYSDDVWWRGIVDLAIIDGTKARIIDYKTGRNTRYADTGQLDLMALAVFIHYEEVEVIQAALMFVLANKFIKAKYKRKNISELWEKWLTKYSRMEKAFEIGVWNANPSGLCRKHCMVTECPHNGRNT